LLLVGVLAVSIGLALIMITVNGAFNDRLDEIRSQVGTSITVRPAGTFGGGFFISGSASDSGVEAPPGQSTQPDQPTQQTLTDDDLAAISDVEHAVSYSRRVSAQYSGDSLESSIEPPPGLQVPEGAEFTGPPILVAGTEDAASLTAFGGQADLVEGRSFNPDESEANVAVIGQSLAAKNGLAVGDSVDLDGTTVEIIGIFTTGTRFGDNQIALPLETARTIFGRGTEVDEVTVQADTAANVPAVADAIREALGEDKADVTSSEGQFDLISSPVADAQDSSRVATMAALAASAAIILFSVGIVVRQRVKEIGVLKAVGASGWHVVGQMTTETLFIAVAAAVIGALATFPFAQSVANGLVSDPATAGPQLIGGPGGGPPPGAIGDVIEVGAGPAADAGGVLGNVDVAVSPEVFLYALGIAIVLALLATIIPAWYVGRVRPAEVLRYE
jgi:putative ABC transport system permease protein